MKKIDVLQWEVQFYECDLTGYVNISAVFKWFERARFQLMQSLNMHKQIGDDTFNKFLVIRSQCAFFAKMKPHEQIHIETVFFVDVGRKMRFSHTILSPSDRRILAQGITEVAMVATDTQKIKPLSQIL